MDAIKEYLRIADRLEHEEITPLEYDELCEPLRNVVEVVRCKDCKHYKFGSDDMHYCFMNDSDHLWQDDDYCSYGEPKSESLRFYKKAKAYADGFQTALEDGMKEAEEKTSVVSDLKRILNSNLVYLIDNAKNFNEQIERWDAVKNTNWIECKRGKWIIREPIHMHSICSCCGFYNAIDPYYKYCPNCGADMRGAEDDER